ncbi:hypothetical protein [Polaromonas sp. C04]|uniref:hypothetical protein n=1 Tax=Polaromonas sp. C04 TaxID=1945857 RepID=UPI000987801B|nr:hypothetical protein [Polaromonas sp. C04]OOG53034.1 hypothetical protein B0E49_11125 [Polaromonas sp. C04]
MSDLIAAVVRFVLRIFLLLMALVFIASLLLAGAVLLAVWGVRRLWARLTGRPVSAWVFHVDPRAQWSRFYHAADQWPARSPRSGRTDESSRKPQDIQDVEVKEPKPPADR